MLTKFGSGASSAPSSLDTSEPRGGYWIGAGRHVAGAHVVGGPAVVGFLGAHGADDGHLVAELGDLRQMFADLDAGGRGLNLLEGPPLAWPGLRSKVSIWLGPPFIHRRMHGVLALSGSLAVSAASASSQPDIEAPSTPAVASFIQSRRDNIDCRDGLLMRMVLQVISANGLV